MLPKRRIVTLLVIFILFYLSSFYNLSPITGEMHERNEQNMEITTLPGEDDTVAESNREGNDSDLKEIEGSKKLSGLEDPQVDSDKDIHKGLSPKPTIDGQFPYNVLLLSSVGRSGSSFLGELLTSQGNVVYFFEPFHDIHELHLLTEKAVVEGLKDIFTCNISNPLLSTFQSNPNFVFKRFHKECSTYHTGCLTKDSINERCKRKAVRVVKTIRTRVSWQNLLIKDSKVNMKIIHLIRDPRASISSGWDRGWTLNASSACADITNDMRSGLFFTQKYPGKYLAVRYEDLCEDTWGVSTKIYSFLGFKSLPNSVSRYLKRSTTARNFDDPFGTRRNTRTMQQKWRSEIKEEHLMRIERVCAPVIQELGFRLFGHISVARNYSVPLYDKKQGNRLFSYSGIA